MSEMRDLYQQLIVDHARSPRNFGRLDGGARRVEGVNPLCGDRLTLFVRLEGDRVAEARFEGSGCAISTASASLLTEAVRGRTVEAVQDLIRRFHDVVTAPPGAPVATEGLGKPAVLAGVREFPARVKCATLAWHSMRAALTGEAATVTTEA
jgi:nitrogen fixation NifU-like protein